MKNSAYADFTKSLKEATGKAALERLSAVCGPSDYLLEATVAAYTQCWKRKNETTPVISYANELNADDIRNLCQQESMFEPRNLYIFKNAERCKDLKALIQSLAESSLQNTVLFVVNGNRYNGHLKKIKGLRLLVCAEPNAYEIFSFLDDMTRKHKIKFDQAAKKLLIEALGNDLAALENEVRALALLHPDIDTLKTEHLQKDLNVLREEVAFKLRQYLMEGRVAKAQTLQKDLLKRGESVIAINGLLARHCRNALQVKHYFEAGLRKAELAKKAGIPPFQIESYLKYCQKVSPQRLRLALQDCAKIDRTVKSSRVDGSLLLDQVALCLAAV